MDHAYSEAIRQSDELNLLAMKSINEEHNNKKAEDYYHQSIELLLSASSNMVGIKKAMLLKRICNIQSMIKGLK